MDQAPRPAAPAPAHTRAEHARQAVELVQAAAGAPAEEQPPPALRPAPAPLLPSLRFLWHPPPSVCIAGPELAQEGPAREWRAAAAGGMRLEVLAPEVPQPALAAAAVAVWRE